MNEREKTLREQRTEQCLGILRFSESLAERKMAAAEIIVLGEAVIPRVISHALHDHPARWDMVRLLVHLGSGRTIGLLMDKLEELTLRTNGESQLSGQHFQLIRELLEERSMRATREDIPVLVRVVRRGAQRVDFYPIAMVAAKGLLNLAEREPSRELLPALEALRAGIANPSAPLEFIPIRLRLVRALKKLNNLPIPADAPKHQITEDLPIPFENEQ